MDSANPMVIETQNRMLEFARKTWPVANRDRLAILLDQIDFETNATVTADLWRQTYRGAFNQEPPADLFDTVEWFDSDAESEILMRAWSTVTA